MSKEQYDITREDLNPTFLFICKGARIEDEKNYHCHDFIEMDIILSGKGKYYIENKMYEVEEGDVLIFNPGTHHQAIVLDKNKPIVEFFVGFTEINFKDMQVNHLNFKNGTPILHTKSELRYKLFKLCTSMLAENEVLRLGRYFMMKTYLVQMLLLIIREQSEPLERRKGYAFESFGKKYVVEQIINYFEEHFEEKISLDQIAENMYLSPFYISKIFKSETGDTPIRHLIDIRLDKAKEMLELGKVDNIQTAADSVGYEDAYHFSKLFKKRFGVTPSQVKNKNKKL
ncbi:MAG TPA: AraC family transcriptional regulator [Lachnospiraceae bacterium]|nr:AraC family transcriptional regulator [Lachnospiraceae bacterium]